MIRTLRAVLCVLLLLTLASCTSFQEVAPLQWMVAVEPDDTVRVTKRDGKRVEFVVERVLQPDRIQGGRYDLRISEIHRIEVAVSSGGFRTVWEGISLGAKLLLAR